MRWTPVKFGRHAGKSLPEIILADADWLSFGRLPTPAMTGGLATQAQEVGRED
jgi:hypothetical protein